jgi:hypothetical protein
MAEILIVVLLLKKAGRKGWLDSALGARGAYSSAGLSVPDSRVHLSPLDGGLEELAGTKGRLVRILDSSMKADQ